MKVLNLRCAAGHGFEGWFASEDDFNDQTARKLVECPLCGDSTVSRLPSAPRLNLSGAKSPTAPATALQEGTPAPTGPAPADPARQMQAAWMHVVREVLNNTEDVGERFPEEARKIHYGEADARGIRGQATPEQRAELSEEGIEVMALPVPKGLKGPAH